MVSGKTYDMTTGKPVKLLLSFAVPMLIGNLFQQLYNMVDAMVVGQFVGANALGAVGATGSINFLFFALNNGLANGIGIIIAQYFGAKNDSMVRKSIASCVYLMTVVALVMGTFGFLAAPPIMRLMNTPEAIIDDAVLYMRIYCAGMITLAAYNGVSSILRALGDSKTPLVFLIISSIINVVLDLVFVLVFHWEVFGVGFATVLAQGFSALGCMFYVVKRVSYFKIPRAEWRYDRNLIRRCISFGVPLALQSSMISLSIIVLQSVVNSFGETVVAAFTAGNRFEQLVQQPFMSLGSAVATFTGQNIGAGQKKRVKQGFATGICLAMTFAVLMIPVALLLGEGIMRLFTKEQEVIAIGAVGIKITTLFYIPLGIIHVTRNVMNGAGDAKFPMLSGIVEVCGRVGFAKPLTAVPAIGFWGIWLTTGVTWTLTAAMGLVRYYFVLSKDKNVKSGNSSAMHSRK